MIRCRDVTWRDMIGKAWHSRQCFNVFLYWFDNFIRRHPQRKTRKKTKKELVCTFFIFANFKINHNFGWSSGHLHVNVLLYSDLSMALNGEIDYKLILFMSFFICLLVLVEASYLQLFSFILGKRTGNKRILESTSKENFKVCFERYMYLPCAAKHNDKTIQLNTSTNTKRSCYSFTGFTPTCSEPGVFVIYLWFRRPRVMVQNVRTVIHLVWESW